MFGVAVFATAAAAFGPIELHSADQATLDGILTATPLANLGLTLLPSTGQGSTASLLGAARSAPKPPSGRPWFGPPITTEQASFTAAAAGQGYTDHLTSRTGACAHLTMVAGHCPVRSGTVILSTRSARALRLGVGEPLEAVFGRRAHRASLLVVGLYRPGSPLAPFWWDQNYFGFGAGSPVSPLLDDAFASPATLRTVPPALVAALVQVPFRAGSLSVDSAGSMTAALSAYEQSVARHDAVLASTELPAALDRVVTTWHTTATIVGVVVVQLVLLALFVLYFVADRTAAERLRDVGLAELRGYRPRSTMAVALAEPMAVVVAAVPVGVLAAWAVAAVTASGVFGPNVGASPTPTAMGAALATGVVGIGATALACRQMLMLGIAGTTDSGRRAPTQRVVGDVVVVALAGASFFELVASGVGGAAGTRDNPLVAFAPGLLALAVGVLGARLLPAVLRVAIRRTAHSPRVALALAVRRVARRREFAAPVMLVTLAVGLATFAVVGWAVDRRNQGVADAFAVGASRVLTVEVRPGTEFLSAVRASDPSGAGVMAAAVERANDGITLAVDASRMPGVVSWPPGLSRLGAAQVARRLVPPGLAPPVEIRGRQLEVTVVADLHADPAPQLVVDLFDRGYQTPERLVLGTLRQGTATYRAGLSGLCPGGCRLVDLAFSWSPPVGSTAVGHAVVSVTAIAASLHDTGRWTGSPSGVAVSGTAAGLTASLTLSPFAPVTLAPADAAGVLPVVVTPSTAGPTLGGGPNLVGLDGQTLTGRVVSVVPSLPRLGADATLVDLGTVERSLSGPFTDVTTQVWLSPAAPAGIVARLRAHGISVVGSDSVVSRQRASAHSGVILAYRLFLLAALAAAALAVGATAFGLAAGARRRGPELAALRAIGLSAPVLRRSVWIEQALSTGLGAVLGVAAGVTAAAVALRSVPELASQVAGPPLDLGLPPAVLAATVAVLAAALSVVAVLGASAVVEAARLESLGGSPT